MKLISGGGFERNYWTFDYNIMIGAWPKSPG